MCHKDASRFESLARILLHCCAVTHGHSSLPSSTDQTSAPTAPLSPMHARLGGDAHLPFLAYLLCSAACPQHTAILRSFLHPVLVRRGLAWLGPPIINVGIICSVIKMEPGGDLTLFQQRHCSRSADGWRRHMETCGANQSVGAASVAMAGDGLHSFSGLLIAHLQSGIDE